MIVHRRFAALAVAIVVLTLPAFLLAGCSMDRRVRVEPGAYSAVRGGAGATMDAARKIQRLDIDRDGNRLVFTLVDGSEIVASFVPRERTAWPAGCPANIQSTRMEVLDILPSPLSIGASSLSRPVLVRDCPGDPVRIVLREDGAIGGAFTACPYPEPCIYFAPQP